MIVYLCFKANSYFNLIVVTLFTGIDTKYVLNVSSSIGALFHHSMRKNLVCHIKNV